MAITFPAKMTLVHARASVLSVMQISLSNSSFNLKVSKIMSWVSTGQFGVQGGARKGGRSMEILDAYHDFVATL